MPSLLYFFLIITILSVGCNKHLSQKRQPNIVFLFADDQRFNTINSHGNNEIKTPNLDHLSETGFTFNNAYIMGGTSAAVCAPSRAMLMTGKSLYHLSKDGDWKYPISPGDTTFPELLRLKGYRTCGIGKQHNGREVFSRGFSSAGHIMFGGMSSHYDIPVHDFHYDSSYQEKSKYRVTGKHSTDLYTDDAVRFIRSYDQEEPFLLYVAFQAPHDPREMPESYLEMYADRNITIPPNFLPHHPFDNGELVIRDELLADFPRTREEIIKHIKAYYAMITHLDAGIGRITEAIKEKGILDNTLIIFSSDNGLAVGQHGLLGKQNLYEHSIKVPLIITGPGIPRGEKTDIFCYIHDLYPTICDYLGFPIPATVESASFIEVLKNPEVPHRDMLVFGYRQYQRAIRKNNWKLIEYHVNGERNTQLFNLEKDPFEMRNLASFPGNNEKLSELQELLIEQSGKLDDHNGFWSWLE